MRTTSASSSFCFFDCVSSTTTFAAVSVFRPLTAVWPRRNLTFSPDMSRCIFARISPSAKGARCSLDSTIVTSVPSRLYDIASSSPTMPVPTTRSRFGITGRARAPTEVTIRFSSTSMGPPGTGRGSHPAAIIMFLARTVCFVPSGRSTLRRSLSTNVASPQRWPTPLCLKDSSMDCSSSRCSFPTACSNISK